MSGTGNKRGVVVGINYVGKNNALKGCVNDALAMRSLLVNNFGYTANNVRVLIDEPARAPLGVICAAPTRSNILEALDWLLQGAKRGDQLFFSYSGHGVQAPDRNRDERDGRDECFLFLDGVLTDDDFARIVLMRVPRGVKMTVITDCCHSGTLCDLVCCYSRPSAGQAFQTVDDTRGVSPVGDVISLSAALDSQVASDGAFEGKWVNLPNGQRQFQWGDSHGAFTWALLKVLDSATYAPLAVDELLARLDAYITNTLKKPQIPHVSVSRWELLKATVF